MNTYLLRKCESYHSALQLNQVATNGYFSGSQPLVNMLDSIF